GEGAGRAPLEGGEEPGPAAGRLTRRDSHVRSRAEDAQREEKPYRPRATRGPPDAHRSSIPEISRSARGEAERAIASAPATSWSKTPRRCTCRTTPGCAA